MKKLLIVDVPEGKEITSIEIRTWNANTGMAGKAIWKLITMPTEEEIFKEAKSLYCGNADSKDRIIFQYACGWYRNVILKQI